MRCATRSPEEIKALETATASADCAPAPGSARTLLARKHKAAGLCTQGCGRSAMNDRTYCYECASRSSRRYCDKANPKQAGRPRKYWPNTEVSSGVKTKKD